MKLKIALVPFILFLSFSSFAQDKLQDLMILNGIIKKTPSFKSQIKGSKKEKYNELFNELKLKTDERNSDLQHFEILSELAGQIKDNHFVLQYIPDSSFDWNRHTEKGYVEQFLKKEHLIDHPKVKVNIDSLEVALKNKPRIEVDGIYYFHSSMKIGVYRIDGSTMKGVILESYLPIWERGDMCFILKEKSPNFFHSIQYLASQKTLQLDMNEKFKDGELIGYGLRKDPSISTYPFLSDSVRKFHTYLIDPDTRYVRLGDFMVNSSNRKRSVAFFNEIRSSMKEKNILLDLRNNNGGGFAISRPFLKLFKRYSKANGIKVLINRNTVSNAEQFVIRLKEKKNVTLYGEDTQGMITYGSNYGKQLPLKSKGLFVYPTDMRGLKKDLQYETIGVVPNFYLRKDSDWIEQVLKLKN